MHESKPKFNLDFHLISNGLLLAVLISSVVILGYLEFDYYRQSLGDFLGGCSSFFIHGMRLALAISGVYAWQNGKLGGAFIGAAGSAYLSWHVHCHIPDLAAHFATEPKFIQPLTSMFILFDWAGLFLEIRLGIAARMTKPEKEKSSSAAENGSSAADDSKKSKPKRKKKKKKKVEREQPENENEKE